MGDCHGMNGRSFHKHHQQSIMRAKPIKREKYSTVTIFKRTAMDDLLNQRTESLSPQLVISLSHNKKAKEVWRELTWLILHLNHCTKRADSNCLLRMAPVSGLKLSYGLRSTASMLCCTHFRSNLLKEQEEEWSNKNFASWRGLFDEHIEVEMKKKILQLK